MWLLRWLRNMARWLLWSLQLAPLFALVAAIRSMKGPREKRGASSHFFPVVLWLFDDFAWTCARNSIIFAGVVSTSSLVLGVGLRCALARLCGRGGRSVLGAASLAVAAVSPAFLALGLTGLFGEPKRWPWPLAGTMAVARREPGIMVGGLALAHVDLVVDSGRGGDRGACLLRRHFGDWIRRGMRRRGLPGQAATGSRAICTGRSCGRRRPAPPGRSCCSPWSSPAQPSCWDCAAASHSRSWRPPRQPSAFPRTAVWALMAGLVGFCGWLVFRWMGGPQILAEPPGNAAALDRELVARRESPVFSAVWAVTVAAWVIVAWLPVLGLFRLVARHAESTRSTESTLAGGHAGVNPTVQRSRRASGDERLGGLRPGGCFRPLAHCVVGRPSARGFARARGDGSGPWSKFHRLSRASACWRCRGSLPWRRGFCSIAGRVGRFAG